MTKPKKKPTPTPHDGNADAVTKLTNAQECLDDAQTNVDEANVLITDAIALLGGGDVAPPEPDGDVIDVGPGDDLKAAIEDAPDGATLRIDPAFQYVIGTYTLKKSLRLVSGADLPPGRVDASLVGPQLTDASITIGAPGCEFVGLRIEGDGATMITAGDSMLLDRCVLLGRPGKTQHRGVAANAADITIDGCHIGSIYSDIDTQAVGCWEKTKRLRIRNSLLEAAGENFMAGGSDAKTAEDIPTDIVIEDCTLSKPIEWKTTDKCVVKNLLELKCAIGFTLRRSVLENCWAHGQGGFAIVLAVRNQNGAATFSTIEDVVIEDVTIKHVGAGLSVLGRDYTNPSQIMQNVVFRRITIEDLSKAHARGSAVAVGRAFQISGGPHGLTFEDVNANILPGKINAAIYFDTPQFPCEDLAFHRCEMHEGSYGIIGCIADAPAGVAQLEGHAPGYAWSTCTVQRGTSGRIIQYPPDTTVLPPVGAREYDGDQGGTGVDG